ncbi:hypothetical protein, partial [Mesorhizobium sp. M7A.F.Ca.CA.004.05.2.1]|uniref:hypothetical protein n=1 Tax=Mesorhizobium sp. M7A.F.Ca.CA.004.05.2.1 TaxID=2496716 RepID=UPI0019D0ED87
DRYEAGTADFRRCASADATVKPLREAFAIFVAIGDILLTRALIQMMTGARLAQAKLVKADAAL